MTVRYSGKDEILVRYFGFGENEFGNTPSGVNTTLNIGLITEFVPLFDPEIRGVYILRSGSVAGVPFQLRSKRKSVGCRLTWIQQSTPSVDTKNPYIQHNFLKDPQSSPPNNNFFLEAQIKRDASNLFWIRLAGLKPNIFTIRGSIGEPQTWIMECLGKSMDLATDFATSAQEAEDSDPPWMWEDTYLQYDAGGGYALFPDLTDYEIRIEKRLKANYCFNSTGSKELTSLEPMEYQATTRLTANLTSKTFLEYLLNMTDVKLKLMMPDSKYIEMTGGKFRAVEPTLKPEDLIAQRIDYIAKDYTHNF